MLEVSSEEITEGNLLRALVVLALPLLAQNVVQVLQQVIDILFLGRYSGDAVAAVGLATPLVGLLFVAVFVTFVGTQVVVSQRVGNDDRFGARQALFTGLVLAVGLGLLVGVVTYVAATPLLELLASVRPDDNVAVVEMAAQYLSVLALGLPVLAFADTVEGGFVAHGDSRASLYMNLLALVGNVVFDPLLIFGWWVFPELGITGAALATVIGSALGSLLGFVLFARQRNDGMLSRAAATVDPDRVQELLSVGLPVGGQQGIRHLIRLPVFLLVFIAGGTAGLTAYVVGARVAAIAFVPPQGLQQAAQSIVGQNLGGGNPHRARRTTWLGVTIASGSLAVVGLAQWVVPGPIAVAFVPTVTGDALAWSIEYLRILAIGYPALGAIYLFEAGFNGAKRSNVSFAATLLQYGGVRLPIAAFSVVYLSAGVVGVFWAVTISNIATAVGLGLYYRYSVGSGMMSRAAQAAAAD